MQTSTVEYKRLEGISSIVDKLFRIIKDTNETDFTGKSLECAALADSVSHEFRSFAAELRARKR